LGWRLVVLLACIAGTVGLFVRVYRHPPSGPVAHSTSQAPYNPQTDREFQRAVTLRQLGRLAEAEEIFNHIATAARADGNLPKEIRVLIAKGGVQLRRFFYREAAQTYYKVLELARASGDDSSTGAALVNLAEIHIQLMDLQAAEREVNSAIKILGNGGPVGFLVPAEIQLGSILAALGEDAEARKAYQKAINLAAQVGDVRNEALAWLSLGQALTKTDDLRHAEDAYLQAYRLYLLHHDPQIDTVRAKLAELESSKGNVAEGLRQLDSVLAAKSPAQLGIAKYQILFVRAHMLGVLGREKEALNVYRQAVDAATAWRGRALPGEVANAGSVESIHAIYAEASDYLAGLAKEHSDASLAQEALETLATNRAADLREQRALAWQKDGRLPPLYYQLLNQLRDAETDSILRDTNKVETERLIRQTRADLGMLETQLAMDFGNSLPEEEKFGSRKRLVDIQQALAQNDVLFSFNLGKRRSWVWVLTNRTLNLEQLPDGPRLERAAADWASNVRTGGDSCSSGSRFASQLLENVPPAAAQKQNWLVVADGTLFSNVPLAALPDVLGYPMSGYGSCQDIPIVQNHTIRYLSSEFSISRHRTISPTPFRFAGIGDPIYNRADSRLTQVAKNIRSVSNQSSVGLARLVGSGTEVRQSASVFQQSTVLTGTQATTSGLAKLFALKPAVVHFALHVVARADRPEEAALAMSIAGNNVPELLTPELIATYRVPGSLVVMSGCDSQQGRAVPGVGVRGLSRAWLLAGASAVITSTWPMPDDDGRFFRSYYQHLNADVASTNSMPRLAAAALAKTQNDMRAASGFRRLPSFWAAYTLISKE
jgi:tetratricopeptide (TPR) repeat protein